MCRQQAEKWRCRQRAYDEIGVDLFSAAEPYATRAVAVQQDRRDGRPVTDLAAARADPPYQRIRQHLRAATRERPPDRVPEQLQHQRESAATGAGWIKIRVRGRAGEPCRRAVVAQ